MANAVFLIETVLGIKVHSIQPLDKESFSYGLSGKQVRFDCAFLINKKITVVIEMQAQPGKYDNQRYSHYANLISAENMVIGDTYVEGSVYVITLLGY